MRSLKYLALEYAGIYQKTLKMTGLQTIDSGTSSLNDAAHHNCIYSRRNSLGWTHKKRVLQYCTTMLN